MNLYFSLKEIASDLVFFTSSIASDERANRIADLFKIFIAGIVGCFILVIPDIERKHGSASG